MTVLVWVGVALLGGVGALARRALDGLLSTWWAANSPSAPWS